MSSLSGELINEMWSGLMQASSQPAGFYDAAPMALDRGAGWSYIRSRGDVFEADGVWYLVSREAAQFAQRHPEIFSSAAGRDLGSPVPMLPLMIDPPDHGRYRRILDPMLSPRVVNALEGELRALVATLIDAFAQDGSCEAVSQLAELYPAQVLLRLLGLPVEDHNQLREWSDVLTSESLVGDASTRQRDAAGGLFEYLGRHVAAKKAAPGDDIISNVLALEGGDAWTDREVLGMGFLFVLAALDTTSGAIGFTLYHLARRPDLQAELVANPDLINPFVEEVLRLELPAPHVSRMCLTDVEVCGVPIPAGAKVRIVMATANREIFDGANPDDIDLEQAGRGHLTFGGGIHRCLGSHLARRELRLVVEEFHKRIPSYRIKDGCEPEIQWPTGTYHLRSLPLVFDKEPV